MTDQIDKTPECFGVLDIVFPMEDDGLRHSPDACMACKNKTECLRTALGKPAGIDVQEERVDRAYTSGSLNFFQRWARKKSCDYRRRKRET